MSVNLNTINSDIRAIGKRVIVSNMHFGEQKTKSGLILRDDNGTTRGIYPRWGQVYSKGPDNADPYEVGDWILVEHGRWTRGFDIENEKGRFDVRMVDDDAILAWSDEKPDEVTIGAEYSDGPADIDPSSFINA
jgi:co-chaperonin GroES (HSP10)